MQYSTAKSIRGTRLSSLITNNLNSDRGAMSSIGRAVTQKVKASAVGVKEKFDPLNMVRAMTGGSRLATTLFGRMTGRSKSDINYFGGGRATNVTGATSKKITASPNETLSQILDFLMMTSEKDSRRRATELAFMEEKKNEEEKRHQEFLSLLKVFTGLGGTTVVEQKQDTSIFDTLKNLLKGLVDAALAPFKWILDFKDILSTIKDSWAWISLLKGIATAGKGLMFLLRFMTGPFGLTLMAMTGMYMLAEELRKLIKTSVPDYTVLTPQEAANILEDPIRTEQYGGREKLVKIITEGPQKAKELLKKVQDGAATDEEIMSAGGLDKINEIVKQENIKIPEKVELPEKVTPRPNPRRAPQQALIWDDLYSKNYNIDGTKRKQDSSYEEAESRRFRNYGPQKLQLKPGEVTGLGTRSVRGAVSERQTEPEMTPLGPMLPTTRQQPSQINPASPITLPQQRVNDVINENIDLQLNENNMNNMLPGEPIVSKTIKNLSKNVTIPTSASMRDETTILTYVLNQSASYV